MIQKRQYKTNEKELRKVWQKTFKNKNPFVSKLLYLLDKFKSLRDRKNRKFLENMNPKREHIGISKLLDHYPIDTMVCYLTGELLDISNISFDHKIPVSKGGDCTFENLGLTTKLINRCKSDLSDTEFIELCRKVTEYQQLKSNTL